MADRKAATMQLSGNDYAKVAERLKLFRTDFPASKSETDHVTMSDGLVEFKAWLWKDKSEFMDLIKGGVTDKSLLRSTADADGDAKGSVGTKQKDFEKLQTIAMGRALANLGYLASGEIASFEEMAEFYQFKEQQRSEEIDEAIEKIQATKTNDELNALLPTINALLKFQGVIDAGKQQRAKLAEKAATQKPQAAPAKPAAPSGGKRVETPAEEPTGAPTLALDEEAPDAAD